MPLCISVEGEIGAGKTTAIEHVTEELRDRGYNVVVIPEPVEKWKQIGILEEFYNSVGKEEEKHITYEFQTYTFVTRVEYTLKAFRENPDAEIFISERSIFSDRYVFVENLKQILGRVRMKMYEDWWSMWKEVLPKCFTESLKMIYLKPSINSCQERVNIRKRDGEDKVSYEYQEGLRAVHEMFLQGINEEQHDIPPRPFDINKDVFVVDREHADSDFVSGEGAKK